MAFAPFPAPLDQSRALQHIEMLGNPGNRHAHRRREFTNREFAAGKTLQHRPSRRARKRAQCPINVTSGLTTFNHVVDISPVPIIVNHTVKEMSSRETDHVNSITHEFSTAATAKAAYDAVATSNGIKSWWAKVGTVAAAVGGATELRFDKGGRIAVMKFRVDVLDPNRMVRWTCSENANPVWPNTTLTWTIRNSGDHRVVSFAHEGFTQGGPPYDMTVDGWKPFNASLESYLSGSGGTPSN